MQALPVGSVLSILSVSDSADGVCAVHDNLGHDFEAVPALDRDEPVDMEIQVRHTFIHFSSSGSLGQRTVRTA